MKRVFLTLLSGLAVFSMLVLTACNKDQPTSASDDLSSSDEISLEKEFGGYTASDEMPAFGDDALLEESAEDVEVSDPVSEQAALQAESGDATLKAYVLRIKWGLLQGDSTATEVVEWSGSASINKGTLAVLKTIAFESEDAVQLPRTSRHEVSFTSFTRPHLDGLVLLIIDNDTTEVEGQFTLIAGAYSRTFLYSVLDSMEVLDPVGSNGHEVSIVSRSREVKPFDGGFLAGRWIKLDDRSGEFHGRWINSLGTNAGHLRGIWGVRRNGQHVFFGKYISLNGEFGGLLRGEWGYTRGEQAGWFAGKWHDQSLNQTGELRGHFKTGRPDDGRGFFHGRWFKSRG